MLTLYHANSSVCSIKVRIGLAEKQLSWESRLLDLQKGDQCTPEYLRINPNGVVPTLDHDGFIVIESSIILQYIDQLNSINPLMPTDIQAQTTTRLWLHRCIDIHAAINTMTFATVGRKKIIATNTTEEIEKSIQKMPNPKAASKRRDLIKNGLSSDHLLGDFFTLLRVFEDMQSALDKYSWLTGNTYGLADTGLIAYIDRLDRLGMSGLWQERFPRIDTWLKASKARPSYSLALDSYISQQEAESVRNTGLSLWPDVKRQWDLFTGTRETR